MSNNKKNDGIYIGSNRGNIQIGDGNQSYFVGSGEVKKSEFDTSVENLLTLIQNEKELTIEQKNTAKESVQNIKEQVESEKANKFVITLCSEKLLQIGGLVGASELLLNSIQDFLKLVTQIIGN